ncbi:hypothetical protein ACVMAJ_005563 [Bradyrhizobium sp. USDA 4448]
MSPWLLVPSGRRTLRLRHLPRDDILVAEVPTRLVKRSLLRARPQPPLIENLTLAGVALQWSHATPSTPHTNRLRRTTAQDHLRRDARDGPARSPSLLPLRASRRSERGLLAGRDAAVRSRAAFRLSRAMENCPLILPQMTMLPKRTLVFFWIGCRESEQAAREARPTERRSERAACGASAKEPVRI